MAFLLILSLSFANDCYSQLAIDTKYSQEEVTKILMSCNNQFLIGQTIFLNNSPVSDKIIRKYYPVDSENVTVTEVEKAHRLLNYAKCEEISANLKKYMDKCNK